MKVAVTSKGVLLDSEVDPRFGRAPYIMVVDVDTMAAPPMEAAVGSTDRNMAPTEAMATNAAVPAEAPIAARVCAGDRPSDAAA